MTKKHIGKIKKIELLLQKMGINYQLEISEVENGFQINIKTEDSSLLIGRGGENLHALQHISNLILLKDLFEEKTRFHLDVNDYRKNQKQALIFIAQNAERKVSSSGLPEVLRSMTSFERKTIHLELSKYPNIFTESIGEEPNRRIVVKIKK